MRRPPGHAGLACPCEHGRQTFLPAAVHVPSCVHVYAGGDALAAFKRELARIRLHEPLLHELLAEYASYRGLLDVALPDAPALVVAPAGIAKGQPADLEGVEVRAAWNRASVHMDACGRLAWGRLE